MSNKSKKDKTHQEKQV